MRITRSSDWRDQLAFDVPVVAETVLPGDPARCVTCGVESAPLPRTELWAVKSQHPHDPAGIVGLFCAAHTPWPAPVAAPPERATRTRASRPATERAPRAPRASRAPRTPPRTERVAPVCPNCFVEVPPTGVCGMCGEKVG